MAISAKQTRLLDAYRSIGFRPLEPLQGVFGDPVGLDYVSASPYRVPIARLARGG